MNRALLVKNQSANRYLINLKEASVCRRHKDTQRMDASKRSEEEKENKVTVVEVTHTVVDPRTVVVHLHNTSIMPVKHSVLDSSFNKCKNQPLTFTAVV